MEDSARSADGDVEVVRALEASSLRDEVEDLGRRMGSTVGSGLAITALFCVGAVFMEQAGTLWFLGALWLFFIGRLGLINRATGNQLRLKESELAELTKLSSDPKLPRGV